MFHPCRTVHYTTLHSRNEYEKKEAAEKTHREPREGESSSARDSGRSNNIPLIYMGTMRYVYKTLRETDFVRIETTTVCLWRAYTL